MAIFGVTHDEEGNTLQQLAINRKVSIGLPAGDGRRAPKKLDHFLISTKNSSGEWIEDKELTEELRTDDNPLRSLDVVLLSDDIEEVFKTELAWWSASEKKCHGDGKAALRSASIVPNAENDFPNERWIPWPGCGFNCPDLEGTKCKPSGQLYFMFPERPVLGSVCAYFTTSYKTIRQIVSSLQTIKDVTGNRLKGIPLKMVLRPGKTQYKDKQGKAQRSNAFFVNIEFQSEDYKRLVSSLLEESLFYEKSQSLQEKKVAGLLGPAGTKKVEVLDLTEEEQAEIVHPEFYSPEEVEQMSEPANPADDFEVPFKKSCDQLKLSKARRDMLMAQYAGNDLDLLLNFLAEFIKYCANLKPKQKQINAWIDKGSSNPQWLWKHLDEMKAIEAAKEEPKAKKQECCDQPHPGMTHKQFEKALKSQPQMKGSTEPAVGREDEGVMGNTPKAAEEPPHPAEEEKKEEKPTVTDEQQKAGSPWAF